MHLNWAIYNVCDLNIDPHVCFFPTLSQDRAQPIPLAQPEACPQRSERPVCACSPHRSRNGYPGWNSRSLVSGVQSHGASDCMRVSPRGVQSAADGLSEACAPLSGQPEPIRRNPAEREIQAYLSVSQALHRPSHTRHSHHAGSGVGCVMYVTAHDACERPTAGERPLRTGRWGTHLKRHSIDIEISAKSL